MPAIKIIPFDSPHPIERDFGLPADYDTLTTDGRRQARVNAVRQHTAPGTLDQIADRFVRSVRFVDHYYLTPEVDDDGNTTFHPYFYEGIWCPSSPYQDLFTRATLRYTASAGAGPRGFAKSYQIAKEAITLMIAEPVFRITYATSTIPLTELMGNRIKLQFENNSRLIDDFMPEYGNKPLKANPWGMTNFWLSNGSGLFCTSAESRQRGNRPRVYYLDDPEYDPHQSTSVEVLREGTYYLIYRVVLPMILIPGSRASWRGTFISKQHLLWRALQTEEHPTTHEQVAKIPEFKKWCRIIVPILCKGPNDTLHSAWPHRWPIDQAEKERLKLPEDALTIPELREFITEPVFQAEYNCNPGDSGVNIFGELTEEKHGWWFEREDHDLVNHAWKSNTLLCFYRKSQIIKVPLSSLAAEGWLLYILADTSFTSGASSDYKACGLIAVSPVAEGFMLDAWAQKGPQDALVHAALSMASRWHAGSILAENVKEGQGLVDDLETAVRDNAAEMLKQYEWVPAVLGFHPGSSPKEIRIASSLIRRFQHGLAKVPLRQQGDWPWSMLFAQIRGFNPAARDGGIENDDLLDIFGTGLSSKILKGLPTAVAPAPPPPDPLQRMRDGELIDPHTQLPHLLHVYHSLTTKQLDELLQIHSRMQAPLKPLSL